jgi:hypothetical protein
MSKKTALSGLVLALVVSAFVVFGGGHTVRADPTNALQDFDVETNTCLGDVTQQPTLGPLSLPGDASCSSATRSENLTAGAAPDQYTNIVIPPGARLGYPYVWTSDGWVTNVGVDSGGTVANGLIVGGVSSYTDIFCNAPPNYDALGDVSGWTVPEDFITRATNWEASADINGNNESYLNYEFPVSATAAGTTLFDRIIRYRADINTLWLGIPGPPAPIALNLSPQTELNTAVFHPGWMPGDGTTATTSITGAAHAPTTQTAVLCLQSPQTSQSHYDNQVIGNPAVDGLYAKWTGEISAADWHNGLSAYNLSTACKDIGKTKTDADFDCWADPPGGSDNATGDADQDDDGLPDGIEIAYGSCPNNAFVFTDGYDCGFLGGVTGGTPRTLEQARDTDQDHRTDLEEMVGPGVFLTNPRDKDSDSDTINDGGYVLDADGDGIPDRPDLNGDGDWAAPACTGNLYSPAAGASSHMRCAWDIVVSSSSFEGDNCPLVPNLDQANWDRGNTANGDYMGDACDADKDQDLYNDAAELQHKYVAGECDSDPATTTPLDGGTDRDHDGDGYLDGVECEFGSNPDDPASVPAIPAADQDGDTLGSSFETYVHTVGVNNSRTLTALDVDGDGWLGTVDGDSDGDGIGDGVEVKKFNTSPMNTDSDRDGIDDATEVGCWGPLAMGVGPSMTGVDGTAPSAAPMDCDADGDDDSRLDADERAGIGTGICSGKVTNVNTDITIADGNGTSWDTDNDRVPDGIECLAGTDPTVGSAAHRTACKTYVEGTLGLPYDADADGDGLANGWEVCMWRSSPFAAGTVDTDGDGTKDCKEAMDVNGNKQANATDATFVKQAVFGVITSDIGFDINGNGFITNADAVFILQQFFGVTVCP